ncbi:hypothetical protein HZH68_012804 [Vespula germanica]|uniref:BTB domain-containing protein n=1 Tax=Vespula germanica TaxID=30212 RepID=A0A834JFY8_VESGE|nr:hypothetical protein HZH68_012804 [Vespula germanica]
MLPRNSKYRCKNFTAAKRIGTPGNPTPVRMPHAHPETFRQFIHYIYTGKDREELEEEEVEEEEVEEEEEEEGVRGGGRKAGEKRAKEGTNE